MSGVDGNDDLDAIEDIVKDKEGQKMIKLK